MYPDVVKARLDVCSRVQTARVESTPLLAGRGYIVCLAGFVDASFFGNWTVWKPFMGVYYFFFFIN